MERGRDREAALDLLLDKEAIREVQMRYNRAVDRCDADLMATVYHPDAYDDHMGRIFTGPGVAKEIVDWQRETMVVTTHGLTTQNIEVDGDVAGCESYGSSVHSVLVDGEPRTMMTVSRYVDRLERRDGEWRIAHRQVISELSGYIDLQRFPITTASTRDRNDPSYGVLGSSTAP